MKNLNFNLCKSLLLQTVAALAFLAFLSGCNKQQDKDLSGEWITVSGTPKAVRQFEPDGTGWMSMLSGGDAVFFNWQERGDSLILSGTDYRTSYHIQWQTSDTIILSFSSKTLHYSSTIARQ